MRYPPHTDTHKHTFCTSHAHLFRKHTRCCSCLRRSDVSELSLWGVVNVCLSLITRKKNNNNTESPTAPELRRPSKRVRISVVVRATTRGDPKAWSPPDDRLLSQSADSHPAIPSTVEGEYVDAALTSCPSRAEAMRRLRVFGSVELIPNLPMDSDLGQAQPNHLCHCANERVELPPPRTCL